MTTPPPYSLDVIAPVFQVADVARSVGFYREGLQFDVAFEWADEPGAALGYAILRHGRCELHLAANPERRPAIAYIFVDRISAYYDAVRSRGTPVAHEIADQPWEMREFEIADPDGNRIIFGEHLSRIEEGGDSG